MQLNTHLYYAVNMTQKKLIDYFIMLKGIKYTFTVSNLCLD